MTKTRPPTSFEQALLTILGAVGQDRAKAVTGRTYSRLRDYVDQDAEGYIRLDHAFALEEEYRRQGHAGSPLYDCWGVRLGEIDPEGMSTHADMLLQLSVVLQEVGDATAAAAIAISPNATLAEKAIGIREIDQLLLALQRKRAMLEATMPQAP